ncbi:MAG: hypothetical protein SGJ18_13925 [Pseudomonadota bacterium]|nr:hypothetical protein [Pseudomonadota bacterium]
MKLKLSIPSKTFIIGEYLAMSGGPALIACTEPCFELILSDTVFSEPKITGINAESPAGQFLNKFNSDFSCFDLEFKDPHKTRGGLGASSAQFALLLALYCAIKRSRRFEISPELISAVTAFEAKDGFPYLPTYRDCAWNGLGMPPSGADVIAQLVGRMSYVHAEHNVVHSFNWDFPNIEFALARTGQKTATHEHLKSIVDIPTEKLKNIADTAMQCMLLKDEETFIESVNNYAQALRAQNWVTQHTIDLLSKANSHLPILASKGCGAMGADILLLVFLKKDQEKVSSYLENEKLEVVATSGNLTGGLKLSIENDGPNNKSAEAIL